MLALLIELEADVFYTYEGDLESIRSAVLAEHPYLSEEQRAMVARASELEFEHAAWVLQAATFGFSLSVWPEAAGDQSQFRVRYRMAHWSPRSGSQAMYFDDVEACVDWLQKQRMVAGGFEYAHVQHRPVGAWLGGTNYVAWLAEGRP